MRASASSNREKRARSSSSDSESSAESRAIETKERKRWLEDKLLVKQKQDDEKALLLQIEEQPEKNARHLQVLVVTRKQYLAF